MCESDSNVEAIARETKAASRYLATSSETIRNNALIAISRLLKSEAFEILSANSLDCAAARKNGMGEHVVERLTLTDDRLRGISDALLQIVALPDPLGAVMDGRTRPNGLKIERVTVPIGVIGIIYESRPNVTVDAAALCIKSGNAVVLKGGSEALQSNIALTKVIQAGLKSAGLPESCVSLVRSTDRDATRKLMTLNGLIDCLIPRGGSGLIRAVVAGATIPVIETGTGNCHIYIDQYADPDMAESILINAKVQRPSVCNSAETVLIHKDIAEQIAPRIAAALSEQNVEIRADQRFRDYATNTIAANEDDWYAEYNELIITAGIVDSLEDAAKHIEKYGSHHSDCIITQNYVAAERFIQLVDSAAVFVNASTRFCDGFQFGLGAEIGISNQKLHARGPMGLRELTTYKYVVRGDGQVI